MWRRSLFCTSRSSSLPIVLRLVIGQKLAGLSPSKPAFFKIGLIWPILKMSGNVPWVMDILAKSAIMTENTWGVVGSLVIVLLQILSWFLQWTYFENRLIFGKVKAYKYGVPIFGAPCIYTVSQKSSHLCQILTDLQNFCTAGNSMKFATKPLWHRPPHLRYVATVPWEIKNLNFLEIFNDTTRYGRKCKQIAF